MKLLLVPLVVWLHLHRLVQCGLACSLCLWLFFFSVELEIMFFTKWSAFHEWWFSVTKLWIWKGSLPPIELAPQFMYFLWPTFDSDFEARYEKQSMLEDFPSFLGFLAYALTVQRKINANSLSDSFNPFRCLSWPLFTICTPFMHLLGSLGCGPCSKRKR